MSQDVYALPDLAKKVRHGQRREREERGEREERVVDICVSADGPDPGTQQHAVQKNTAQEKHGDSGETKKNPYKVAGLFLLLLCVLLLAVIIGLVIHNFELIKEKNNNLAKERDEIQFSFDQLKTMYNNLTEEQAQLQSSFDKLETTYYNLTEERGQLQLRHFDNQLRDDFKRILCESRGFTFSGGVCYYISTEKKTWEESKQYCEDNHSTLTVIKSKEKQAFVVSLNQRVWLGLTDRGQKGIWKWVDGTNLTTREYWSTDGDGEPDNRARPDCVEFNPGRAPGGWNDRSCSDKNQWICERVIN